MASSGLPCMLRAWARNGSPSESFGLSSRACSIASTAWSVRPFAKQTWAEGLDSNGRPIRVPDTFPTPEGTLVSPPVVGGTNWFSPAYSPRTELFYVQAYDGEDVFYKRDEEYVEGDQFTGGGFQAPLPIEKYQSAVRAIDQLFTEQLGLNPWVILILMQLSFLLMGTFLDDTAMLVIVAPLYVPLVNALGFDLIWYGVLYTITTQIAYMTPPFGYNLFLMRAMAPPEISLSDIYRSIGPFVGVMILALIVVMAFPQITLWLPNTVYGR